MSPEKPQKFFDETKEQSVVKATIVEHYFEAWAKIIIATQKRKPASEQRIGYVDLFAGPGRYKDGTVSTPLRVLEKVLRNDDLCERLVAIFNDKDLNHANSLAEAINQLDKISKLKHKPEIWNEEVGSKIAEKFNKIRTIPLLTFIDPWGYKGLSLSLVDAFLKGWGCDCIFFFNYARINAGISNPLVREHMEALFGDATERLSDELRDLSPAEREVTVVEALAQALRGFNRRRFVLPFRFKNEIASRTTHHLIFVSKHFKGYEVMKDIMAKQSSADSQAVASFEFYPEASYKQQLLFDLNRPLDDLADVLMSKYAGREISLSDLYREHSVGTPYRKCNYKDVLRELEGAGRISTAKRKSNKEPPDYVVAKFPPQKNI